MAFNRDQLDLASGYRVIQLNKPRAFSQNVSELTRFDGRLLKLSVFPDVELIFLKALLASE